MSYAAIETQGIWEKGPCCIVGFGNPNRQDDGVGPWILEQLDRRPADRGDVRLLQGFQIVPDMVDDLGDAGCIILIDASVQPIEGGWQWEAIEPREDLPSFLHHFNPGFLLHLLDMLYGRRPELWLISIQGERFGHGRGLSPLTRKRAGEVMASLEAFLSKEGKYGDGA